MAWQWPPSLQIYSGSICSGAATLVRILLRDDRAHISLWAPARGRDACSYRMGAREGSEMLPLQLKDGGGTKASVKVDWGRLTLLPSRDRHWGRVRGELSTARGKGSQWLEGMLLKLAGFCRELSGDRRRCKLRNGSVSRHGGWWPAWQKEPLQI